MSIVESLVLLLVFMVAYMAIIEIFTVLFRLTGLTQEKAKTQVISMLTNSGFTTAESELIMSSRKRRRLAHFTMLFGYAFGVIIVSIIVNIFLALSQSKIHQLLSSTLILGSIFLALLFIMRLERVRTSFDHLIERLGNRLMFGKGSNTVVLVDTYGDKAMVEIYLKIVPSMLAGVCLADAQLRKSFDIQVLFIKRGGLSIYKIDGEVTLQTGDNVFVFGDYKNIRSIFEHPDSA